MEIVPVLRGIAGMVALSLLAWLFSENKKSVRVKQVCGGLLIQLVLAAVLLKLPFSKDVFLLLNKGVMVFQEATKAGTSFVFGYIGGGPLPFTEQFPRASFNLAFQALPIILVMSALSALLTYWGSNSKFTNYQIDKGAISSVSSMKFINQQFPGHPEHRKEIAE